MSKKTSGNQPVDITPNPRILRTLGEIPFELWQCIAEIVDNSLDGFAAARSDGTVIDDPRVDIHWSSEDVAAAERYITVADNGPGMEPGDVRNAARAGYSSNDPMHRLGLFGMGFNIATARMGDETLFSSATSDAEEWAGVQINFDDLAKGGTFSAPSIQESKKNPRESGTRVSVRLKADMFAGLRNKEGIIRRQLEKIYTPILGRGEVSIHVQGKQLMPRRSCVWGEHRYVTRKGRQIHAVQKIDRDLGSALFDTDRGRYLSDSETMGIEGKELPGHIVERPRRLSGWLGVQRYCDTTDFGIDMVRNGRKILIQDKSLFGYESPETGAFVHEYPMEHGSTTGGRIVGELRVDYLVPTYQKNAFDKTDKSWRLTVDAVRGAGPLLPQKRKALNYDGENDSPLGLLVNAYRRIDAGTKCLAIPNAKAKELAKKFESGLSEFLDDDKWFKIAQEADREKSEKGGGKTPVNTGDKPSASTGEYLGDADDEDDSPSTESSGANTQGVPGVLPLRATSKADDLMRRSEKQESLSGKYTFGRHPGIDVTGWRLTGGRIAIDGDRSPCILLLDGVRADFFYDLTHPILHEYPLSPKQILLHILAEKFSIRDPEISFQAAFLGLVGNHLADERIHPQVLQERAHSIFARIRESMPGLLGHRFVAVKDKIKSAGMEEALASRLIQDAPHLMDLYQGGGKGAEQCLSFCDESVVVLLVKSFPAEFLDGKFFDLPYETLRIDDESATSRLREQSLEQVLSYLSDVVSLLQVGAYAKPREELLRQLHTLTILERRIVES